MATIQPNTIVLPESTRFNDLSYPPASTGTFAIAVHPGALFAPKNQSTQVIQVEEGELNWAGSIDEYMLRVTTATFSSARAFLAGHLLRGSALWSVITPGDLFRGTVSYQTTIYRDSRLWVVLGEARSVLLAAPLNSGARESKYQTSVYQAELPANVKSPADSTLELNHLWSFPPTSFSLGTVAPSAHDRLADKVRGYY